MAFVGDPPISKLTISLRSGFAFARKALHGLSVKTASGRTRFSATVHRGSLEVKLRSPTARVRVGIGGGLLVAPRRLIRRGRSQIHGKRTQVGVTVIERGGNTDAADAQTAPLRGPSKKTLDAGPAK